MWDEAKQVQRRSLLGLPSLPASSARSRNVCWWCLGAGLQESLEFNSVLSSPRNLVAPCLALRGSPAVPGGGSQSCLQAGTRAQAWEISTQVPRQ